MTPTLPPKATIAEMSSALTVLSETGTRNGAVHVVSFGGGVRDPDLVERGVAGCGFVKVTQSRARLSRAIVTDSMLPGRHGLREAAVHRVALSVDAL